MSLLFFFIYLVGSTLAMLLDEKNLTVKSWKMFFFHPYTLYMEYIDPCCPDFFKIVFMHNHILANISIVTALLHFFALFFLLRGIQYLFKDCTRNLFLKEIIKNQSNCVLACILNFSNCISGFFLIFKRKKEREFQNFVYV